MTKDASKLVTELKHVDIHQQRISQEFQAGKIKVEWVPKEDMVVDGFTRELTAQKHTRFVKELGMEYIKALIQKH